jgi:uncharacterized protein (UPF0276 family)
VRSKSSPAAALAKYIISHNLNAYEVSGILNSIPAGMLTVSHLQQIGRCSDLDLDTPSQPVEEFAWDLVSK